MIKGITLIELMIVLAIIAIMGLLMAPAIGKWVENYRIKQAGRQMVSDFQFAKMKAMSTGHYCAVTFNETVDGTFYSYVIYDDTDNDYAYDAGEIIFKRMILGDEYEHIAFDVSKADSDGISFPGNTMAFDARGLPHINTGGFGAGSVYLINTKNNKGRRILITSAGRVRIDEY